MSTAASEKITSFDPAALQRLLDGRYADVREQVREFLRRPEFASPVAPVTAEYRELVLEWAKTLAGEGLTAPGFPPELGGRGDPGANVASFETLALGDLSLLVKFGVQFGLWGGAVQQLGTRPPPERARKEYTATAACHGRLAAVFAQLIVDGESHGVHALVVPLRDEHGHVC